MKFSKFLKLTTIQSLFISFLLSRVSDNYVRFDIEPVIATGFNINQIMKALSEANIERALVGGWNDSITKHVVYVNGTVAPLVELDYPEVAAFVRTNDHCLLDIIFLSTCNEIFPEPLPCVPISNPIPPVYIPEPCYPVQECPKPCIVEQPCVPIIKCAPVPCQEICEASEPSVCLAESNECVTFPRIRKRVKCSRSSKKKVACCDQKSFEYSCEIIKGCKVPVLIINSSSKSDKKSIIRLDKGERLNIKVMNNPRLLLNVLKFAESKLCTEVCLFVNRQSQLFVFANETLYRVCYKGKCMRLKQLSSRRRCKIEKKGLYNIKIR